MGLRLDSGSGWIAVQEADLYHILLGADRTSPDGLLVMCSVCRKLCVLCRWFYGVRGPLALLFCWMCAAVMHDVGTLTMSLRLKNNNVCEREHFPYVSRLRSPRYIRLTCSVCLDAIAHADSIYVPCTALGRPLCRRCATPACMSSYPLDYLVSFRVP